MLVRDIQIFCPFQNIYAASLFETSHLKLIMSRCWSLEYCLHRRWPFHIFLPDIKYSAYPHPLIKGS
jgi:hypothetical protein